MIKATLIKSRNKFAVFNKGFMGKLIYNFRPDERLRALSYIPLDKDMKILDIGCGAGDLLLFLHKLGFNNLCGADPFIEVDIHYDNGVHILKRNIGELTGKFDIIMLHHVFEHVSNPLDSLISLNHLLSNNGVCIIRIPLSDSYAFNKYGTNWIQFDAPRHFFLHTIDSMKILCKNSNLHIKRIIYDSTEFQFWGSEQNLLNIPLLSKKSYALSKWRSVFSRKRIYTFRKKAMFLNSEERGDQASFFLTRNSFNR